MMQSEKSMNSTHSPWYKIYCKQYLQFTIDYYLIIIILKIIKLTKTNRKPDQKCTEFGTRIGRPGDGQRTEAGSPQSRASKLNPTKPTLDRTNSPTATSLYFCQYQTSNEKIDNESKGSNQLTEVYLEKGC